MNRFFLLLIGVIVIYNSVQAQQELSSNDYIITTSGLKYKITKNGNGKKPKAGNRVWVHFAGILVDNDSIFDNTFETGAREFYLGQGQLIKAWEEGLMLLEETGAMEMIVPPNLGYGKQGNNIVPPNSTLKFEMVLVQIDDDSQIEPFKIEGLKRKRTIEGLKYYVVKQGEGEKAKKGDNAYVNYTGFLSDGTIFDSSHKKDKPVRITVGSEHVFKGWDLAIQTMNVGTKARFIIPSNLAFGTEGYKQIIPPNETITMDLELVEIMPEIIVDKWDAKGKPVKQTITGLSYIVFEEGEGELIKDDNIVEVHYSGYFADGKLFDSSVKRDEPIKFPVGAGIVIDGWDEGVKLMRKGAKFQFLIPANLAYGEQGAPPQIPANADLIFDIEIIDVVK